MIHLSGRVTVRTIEELIAVIEVHAPDIRGRIIKQLEEVAKSYEEEDNGS